MKMRIISTDTTPSIQSVAVYCGSSSGTDPAYSHAAKQVGYGLAVRGIRLVYGGGCAGLMGDVANAALLEGGTVVGVIPDRLVSKEAAHKSLTQLHIVPDMHTRKNMMMDLSDGFITLPGGIGTFEELFEVWTWLQLGYHRRPIGLLNIKGYYDPLLAMMQHSVKQGFVHAENNQQLLVASDLDSLLAKMNTFIPMDSDAWLRSKY
jgi:uncharacterized protein (TIGR00730 family)